LWVEQISHESWVRLFSVLQWQDEHLPIWLKVQHEMLEAMEMLAVRVAALGIEAEVVRCLGISARHTSPFVEQHMELRRVIEQAHERLNEDKSLTELGDHLDVLLDQCTAQIKRAHAQAKVQGISMALSVQLIRLEQSINRMRTLLQLMGALPVQDRSVAVVNFFRALVREENRKHSIADLWRGMTEKLALRITEHASNTGEHYTAENRADYWKMGRAALGGGAIIAFFAFIKTWLVALHLPPFWEATVFSLNYGMCFVVVHLLHCQVATKQPAMTAARIASALESSNGQLRGLDKVVEMVIQVARTQFIAITGNLVLAFATAFGIAYGWSLVFGSPPLPPEKTELLLQQVNPVTSPALPHAALAGVALFFTGVVSGYYDNLCIYERIPARIQKVIWLRKVLGVSRLERFAHYLEGNLGAIMGSLFLGLMLGSWGFIGFLLGLPIDTTHFAFSSANLGFVIQAEGLALGWAVIAWGFFGVTLIGIGNLFVSFGLALYTAMKARSIRNFQGGALAKKLTLAFFKNPFVFIAPPKNQPLEQTELQEKTQQ
ncbi:MAG: recombinase, partial [Limnobacter sp.]|nr:recombinase [Limnobacter sp.]